MQRTALATAVVVVAIAVAGTALVLDHVPVTTGDVGGWLESSTSLMVSAHRAHGRRSPRDDLGRPDRWPSRCTWYSRPVLRAG